MNQNYFRVLFRCIIASFVLLVVAHLVASSPWLTLAAGGLPLVYYHLIYLTPRARQGITQAAIDSVYYFGFLVTVAALGISAVTIASDQGATDINRVVFQFGVGLFATGYAVLARMHLSSMSAPVDETSPEAILDRYIKRSMELVDNAEIAVSRTAEFSKIVIEKTSAVTESARAHAERAMLDVAQTFQNEMKSALALARDGITEIRGMVSDTSFTAEREELARSIKATLEGSSKLNLALEEYAANARLCAAASIDAARGASGLDNALKEIREDIAVFNGEDGALLSAARSLATAGQELSRGTEAMRLSVEELGGFSGAVAEAAPAFQKLKTTSRKANDQLSALEELTGRMAGTMQGFASATQSTEALSTELHRAAQSLPLLSRESERLAVMMQSISEATVNTKAQLAGLPSAAAAVQAITEDVNAALTRIVDSISAAAVQSQSLSAGTRDANAIIAGANDLLSSASGLRETLGSLQQLFGGLADSVNATQLSLASTSSGIKASVAASADALSADVKRSSDAASLLTDRLILVAQHIIDQTRQRQAVPS